MQNCLFCRIVRGEIPSNKIYEDDKLLAFYDIEPQAPVHFLVIPKQHIESCAAVTAENAPVVAEIFARIAEICKQLGVESFRVVSNAGTDAGQSVPHLHFHVLGGHSLAWPPG